jgi:hypothetical protein
VIIIHRSTKGFFRESEEEIKDFGEDALAPSEKQQ